MPRVIHKYPLKVQDEPQEISVSLNWQPLTLQLQNGIPTLWVSNFVGSVNQIRHVHCVGTGQEFNPAWQYLGTVQLNGFVWHYFIS